MPKIEPSLEDVQWPKNEGTIGVVGVAPWATVDFMARIYENSIASKDWHFPRILVDANSKIPSRGRYFDLGEIDPSPFIAETIDELISAGATAVVVPCNTAHILIDRWSTGAKEQVIDIIEATLKELNPAKDAKVVTLGSSHLVRHRTYLAPLESAGFQALAIDAEKQDLVGKIIGEIKVANTLTSETAEQFARVLAEFQKGNVDALILGCTELAQALRCVSNHSFTGKVVDSNAALARAALRAVGAPVKE